MSFELRHKFNGKIDGISIKDIKLDYSLKTYDERKKYIEDILNNTNDEGLNIYEKYLCDYYKANLNTKEELGEKNTVFCSLETMTNYLLGSNEAVENRRKQEYRFYTNENEFKLRTAKEQSLEGIVGDTCSDEVIHFLLTKNQNYKKSKIQVIYKKDIQENSNCGKVLREYQNILDRATNLLKYNTTQFSRFKIAEIKGYIYRDMIITKDTMNGVFGYRLRNQLLDSTVVDWDLLDITNPEHIKLLLRCNNSFNPDNDISFIIMDINNVIEKLALNGSLKTKHIKIIELLRLGSTQQQIADVLNITHQAVDIAITRTAKKIANYNKALIKFHEFKK